MRAKLDRGELRYTWIDVNDNARASDDGGALPPKGWWPRPEFTRIDRERQLGAGKCLFGPAFPDVFRSGVSRRRACRHAAGT